eukprot:11003724-Alexandrium_andersonii.AAC.1
MPGPPAPTAARTAGTGDAAAPGGAATTEAGAAAAACDAAAASSVPMLCAPSHSRPEVDTGSPAVLGLELALLQRSTKWVEEGGTRARGADKAKTREGRAVSARASRELVTPP